GGEECAVEVDREQFLPLGEGELVQRMDDLDSGVAHQYVDAAERRHHGRYAGVDGLFIGDVHRHADRVAACGLDFGGGGIRGLLVQVGDGDLGARTRIGERDLPADAAGGAGD